MKRQPPSCCLYPKRSNDDAIEMLLVFDLTHSSATVYIVGLWVGQGVKARHPDTTSTSTQTQRQRCNADGALHALLVV
jgi:hypothetical protein